MFVLETKRLRKCQVKIRCFSFHQILNPPQTEKLHGAKADTATSCLCSLGAMGRGDPPTDAPGSSGSTASSASSEVELQRSAVTASE